MKRSKFSLSHYHLLTCKMGQLVPAAWFEVNPGDTIQASTSALIRCAPLVTPVMHPVSVRFHWWFVPNRLTWANFTNFITGGPDGLNASVVPTVQTSNVAVSTLADYLGIPTTGLPGPAHFNAMPFRAYANIWNEFYRDQDLQTLLVMSTADGNDTTTNTVLQNICWEKDYLTSARPWVQKGATVSLPLGTSAPVTRVSNSAGGIWNNTGTNTPATAVSAAIGTGGFLVGSGATQLSYDPNGSLIANLAAATSIDINSVRTSFALQRYQEARARYGSRYVEYLRYLGVRSSDARLQRPEYLGGGKNTIQFSEVLQTGVTTSGTSSGVATMFGHGITGTRSRRWRRFFEEHGIVMCLMSVRPKTMYSQRVKRAWYRGSFGVPGQFGTKYDYWQKEIESIGQQGIAPAEADASGDGNPVWGYQDRYDEYRREESSVHGLFRSTLDNWHLSREFGAAPSLNSTFVSCVPSQRVFADTANDNLYVCCNHNIQARRLLKKEGTSPYVLMAKKNILDGTVPGHAALKVDQEEQCRAVFDADGVQTSASIGSDGKEYGDPIPMAPPVGMGPNDFDPIATMIRNLVDQQFKSIRDAETGEEYDTEEEANDFEVDDEPLDPETPYEAVFNPPPPAAPAAAKPHIDGASTRVVLPDRESSAGTDPVPGVSDKPDSSIPVDKGAIGQQVSSK